MHSTSMAPELSMTFTMDFKYSILRCVFGCGCGDGGYGGDGDGGDGYGGDENFLFSSFL